MEKVLARRYRPQTFAEVIGQDAVVRTLRNALAAGRLGHGFIFSGHRGIGKTTVARILAKAMNCRRAPGPTPAPCGECESCREIRDGNSVDVIEIDAASNRGIDEIRALRESVRYRPARDRFKFYILDEAHQLTDDAFNALLKTLEEPPEWAVFVLATTEPEALPATIRSRCQHFAFRAVPYALMVERVEQICAAEGIAADAEAIGLIAAAGEGSLRDALSLLDQALAYGAGDLRAETVRALLGRVSTQALTRLLAAVAAADSRAALERLDEFLGAGASPAQICRQLVQFIRDMLMARVAGPESALLAASDSERRATAAMAEEFSEEDLTRFLQILLRTASELRFAPEPRLHLELGLMKMLHARRLAGIEEVLAGLSEGSPAAEQKKTLRAADPEPARATAFGAAAAIPAAMAEPVPDAAAWRGHEQNGPPLQAVEAWTQPRPTGAASEVGAAPPLPKGDAAGRVLRRLEELKKTSWLSLLRPATWRWEGSSLELVYPAADAPLARLAEQGDIVKGLREVCRATLGIAPEILIRANGGETHAAGSLPEAQAPATPPAERAAGHPVLQEFLAKVPAHVLRTLELKE